MPDGTDYWPLITDDRYVATALRAFALPYKTAPAPTLRRRLLTRSARVIARSPKGDEAILPCLRGREGRGWIASPRAQ